MAKIVYLTPEEVAAHLRVTSATVRRMAREGELAAERIGVQWRIDANCVPGWGSEDSTPAPAA